MHTITPSWQIVNATPNRALTRVTHASPVVEEASWACPPVVEEGPWACPPVVEEGPMACPPVVEEGPLGARLETTSPFAEPSDPRGSCIAVDTSLLLCLGAGPVEPGKTG